MADDVEKNYENYTICENPFPSHQIGFVVTFFVSLLRISRPKNGPSRIEIVRYCFKLHSRARRVLFPVNLFFNCLSFFQSFFFCKNRNIWRCPKGHHQKSWFTIVVYVSETVQKQGCEEEGLKRHWSPSFVGRG